MTESLITALVTQGGFAILAAVLIYLGWRDKKEAREDMKEARALFSRVIDMSSANAAAQTGLTAAVEGLRLEIIGLRTNMHDRVIPIISGLQGEMLEFGKRLAAAERRAGSAMTQRQQGQPQ